MYNESAFRNFLRFFGNFFQFLQNLFPIKFPINYWSFSKNMQGDPWRRLTGRHGQSIRNFGGSYLSVRRLHLKFFGFTWSLLFFYRLTEVQGGIRALLKYDFWRTALVNYLSIPQSTKRSPSNSHWRHRPLFRLYRTASHHIHPISHKRDQLVLHHRLEHRSCALVLRFWWSLSRG